MHTQASRLKPRAAVGERARAFKPISSRMLLPLGILLANCLIANR